MTNSFFGLTINRFGLQAIKADFPEPSGTPDPAKNSLATTITNLRLSLEMSPRQLCALAEIDCSTLKKIIRGYEDIKINDKAYSPRLDTLRRIAAALGVTIGELFDHLPNWKRSCVVCGHIRVCQRWINFLNAMLGDRGFATDGLTEETIKHGEKRNQIIIALANTCDDFQAVPAREEG